MRLFFVVIDGMGDRPDLRLGGKTPLEYANTPNLDRLASRGITGLVYTVGKRIAPESDIAVASLFGNKPSNYCGRGPVEAIGAGMEMRDGYLALRFNFATVRGDKIVDRRVGRSLTEREARRLVNSLSKIKLPVKFEIKHTVGHRGVVVFKGWFSRWITNIDPAYKNEGYGVAVKNPSSVVKRARPMNKTRAARFSAGLVNTFYKLSREILLEHPINKRRIKNGKLPANAILLRDAGNCVPKFRNLSEYFGYQWYAVVGMPLEQAIAKLSGMKVKSFSYPKHWNIHSYTKTEVKNMKSKTRRDGLYYLHFKQTDIAGHDADPKLKAELIEMIDSFFSDKENDLVIVTADHATPCSLGSHSGDPVPLLIYHPFIRSDSVSFFSERSCRRGKLGIILGYRLMPRVKRMFFSYTRKV